MKRFTIADTHFNHGFMAKMRGFKTIVEHDEHIIKIWNETVRHKDIVYFLGDFCMKRTKFKEYLQRLNGKIVFVGGNHDSSTIFKDVTDELHGFTGVLSKNGIFFTHIPVHPIELSYRIRGNVHGHLHENKINDPRYICVSCEHLDYKPIEVETVIKQLEKQMHESNNI